MNARKHKLQAFVAHLTIQYSHAMPKFDFVSCSELSIEESVMSSLPMKNVPLLKFLMIFLGNFCRDWAELKISVQTRI